MANTERLENLFFNKNLDLENLFNKRIFEPEEIFFKKNENFFKNLDLVNKKIDFREKEEVRGRWEDKKLIGLLREFEADRPKIEIFPGNVNALASLVDDEPQRQTDGQVRYLLTSGLAVEVVTGAVRYHHDMDLVLFDLSSDWWKKRVTDNVTPQKYWAQMKFDPAFLEATAWAAHFNVGGTERTVLTVHPAIILIQKLSNAWGRPPRDKDFQDVQKLFNFWKNAQKGDPSWEILFEAAIAALPETEQLWTRERFSKLKVTN